jgi:spermidine synthase
MPIKRPFSDEMMMLDAIQVLVEIETGSQTIQIVDSADHGKCLIIDGVIRVAQKDHYLHDRELVKKLRPNDSTILIVGGGNGYVAQRVIAENPFARVNVDIVDCEFEVVRACERYLGQDVFKEELVKVYTQDICSYLEECGKNYDGIAVDFSKPSTERFWQQLLSLANQRVRNCGWIALRVGKVVDRELSRIQSVEAMTRFLKQNGWGNIESSEVMVPSCGESSPFLFGVKFNEKSDYH